MKRRKDGEFNTQRQEGAALIMALGMLILFIALGTQYVRYMGLEVKATEFDTGQNQSRQLAYGGIYAAIGKVQAALNRGETVDSDASVELPVFKTVYEGSSQGISLDRSYEPVSVAITESGQSGGLASALEEVGLGDALTGGRGRAQAATAQRVFYIESKSGSRTAEAIVAFYSSGASYKIRFWREGRVADRTPAEVDPEDGASTNGGDEAPSDSDGDPAESEETVEAGV